MRLIAEVFRPAGLEARAGFDELGFVGVVLILDFVADVAQPAERLDLAACFLVSGDDTDNSAGSVLG